MTVRSMADLRNLVFDVVSEARSAQTLDHERMRTLCGVLTVAVNVVRVQVTYAAVVKGDLALPFMEETATEPSGGSAIVDPLAAGPSPDHPWRRSVHRLGR